MAAAMPLSAQGCQLLRQFAHLISHSLQVVLLLSLLQQQLKVQQCLLGTLLD
jgi:hypothetical protein